MKENIDTGGTKHTLAGTSNIAKKFIRSWFCIMMNSLYVYNIKLHALASLLKKLFFLSPVLTKSPISYFSVMLFCFSIQFVYKSPHFC